MTNEQFSKNSVALESERYPLMDNVDDMFNFIRNGEVKYTKYTPLTEEEIQDIFIENFTV